MIDFLYVFDFKVLILDLISNYKMHSIMLGLLQSILIINCNKYKYV